MPDETTYTHGHADSVLRSHRWRTVENSAAYLIPHLRSGLDVLDVGCGPGTITLDLAARCAPGRALGLDPSADVIAQATASAAEAGATGVTFAVGDVYALDLPDDSFDVVHAHQVVQHVDDPVRALREMRRVCRPGGTVAVRDSDYAGFTWWPALPELDRWLAVYREVARSNHAEPDAGRRLLAWAHQAGFTDVEASASTWCFATPADRAWWGGLWADRVVGSALATQALERGLATEAELEGIAAGWRRWAEDPDAWFSVLHGELLAAP
jgi:ubiquinone/menaquinone biosynthesis C-methylase UbiE